MSDFCKCGGYLGSGGIDSYSGRYCRCANPIADNTVGYTSSKFTLFDAKPSDWTCPNCNHQSPSNTFEIIEALQSQLADYKAAVEVLVEMGRFYEDESHWSKGYQSGKQYSEIARRDNIECLDDHFTGNIRRSYVIGGKHARQALNSEAVKKVLEGKSNDQ